MFSGHHIEKKLALAYLSYQLEGREVKIMIQGDNKKRNLTIWAQNLMFSGLCRPLTKMSARASRSHDPRPIFGPFDKHRIHKI